MRALYIFDSFDFERGQDPKEAMGIGLRHEERWAHEMVSALEDYKFSEFGGSLSATDIKIEFLTEGAADVTGVLKVGNIQFNLYFSIRDERNWSDPIPKWVSNISISSPQKRGSFTVKATGKNTAPIKLLQKLSEVFDLKFRRR